MPPRTARGGGAGQKNMHQQQPQSQGPLPSNQNMPGISPHHHFHHHHSNYNNTVNYSGNMYANQPLVPHTPQPQHGDWGNNNPSISYNQNFSNHNLNNNMYGSGEPLQQPLPPSMAQSQGMYDMDYGMHPSPYPQQPPQSGPVGSNRRLHTPVPGMQNHPPPHQPGYYNTRNQATPSPLSGGSYRGSGPPPHIDLSSSFPSGAPPPPMRPDSGYADGTLSPPPPNNYPLPQHSLAPNSYGQTGLHQGQSHHQRGGLALPLNNGGMMGYNNASGGMPAPMPYNPGMFPGQQQGPPGGAPMMGGGGAGAMGQGNPNRMDWNHGSGAGVGPSYGSGGTNAGGGMPMHRGRERMGAPAIKNELPHQGPVPMVGMGGQQPAYMPQSSGNMPRAAPMAMPTNGRAMNSVYSYAEMINDQVEVRESLYDFLKERMLLKASSLWDFFSQNDDSKRKESLTIAIDANYMLNQLRARLQALDPLWFMHSLLPDLLLQLIEEHVAAMREKNIEPIWIFNGIGVSGDVETFLPSRNELLARDRMWHKLTEEELPTASEISEAFDTSSSIGEDVFMAIQRFLRNKLNVLTLTAPFLNWCQIVTFHKEGEADLIMGPPEMLMLPYEPMRLIVEIDLHNERVAYFDRDEVLRKLFPKFIGSDNNTASAGDRFLDFGLLIATHPAITAARANLCRGTSEIYDELSSATPRFATLRDFLNYYEKKNKTGSERARHGSEQIKHAKGRSYIQYSAVFSKSFPDSPLVYFKRVLDPSLTNAKMPNNLSGVFGSFLPLSLYYFQYIGLLSVTIMTMISQSYFRDEFPLSDTLDYHEHLPILVSLRGQTLCQLVDRLDPNYRHRLERISWVRWFENILVVVTRPPREIVLEEWNLKETVGIVDGDNDDLNDITISSVLTRTDLSCLPPPLEAGRRGPLLYRGPRPTLYAILLKAFDFLGYFPHSPQIEDGTNEMNVMNGSATCEVGQLGSRQLQESDNNRGVFSNPNGGEEVNKRVYNDSSEECEEVEYIFTEFLTTTLRKCPPEFHNGLLRFTEVLRISILNCTPCRYVNFNNENDNFEMHEEPDDAPEVLLASRIACLISVPYLDKSEGGIFKWAPVYSRHLCAFSVMVRTMHRELRELVEVMAASVFLSGCSDCHIKDYDRFISLLPFDDMISPVGGLLLHYVLVFPADYESNCNTPEERCAHLQKKFKAIPDITKHLRNVMNFTFHALFLLNAYSTYKTSIEIPYDLLYSTVVGDTLNLLHEKWKQHFSDETPIDVHNLWTAEVENVPIPA